MHITTSVTHSVVSIVKSTRASDAPISSVTLLSLVGGGRGGGIGVIVWSEPVKEYYFLMHFAFQTKMKYLNAFQHIVYEFFLELENVIIYI